MPALDAGARAQRLEQALVRLPDRARVDAQVELGQVEAEQRDAGAEIREAAVRDAGAAVLAQAPVDQVELGQQVVGRRVVGVAQPGPERAQPAAIRLVVVLAGRDADQLLVERRVVVDDRRGHPPAARERAHLVPVEPRGERPRLLERRLHRLPAPRSGSRRGRRRSRCRS